MLYDYLNNTIQKRTLYNYSSVAQDKKWFIARFDDLVLKLFFYIHFFFFSTSCSSLSRPSVALHWNAEKPTACPHKLFVLPARWLHLKSLIRRDATDCIFFFCRYLRYVRKFGRILGEMLVRLSRSLYLSLGFSLLMKIIACRQEGGNFEFI